MKTNIASECGWFSSRALLAVALCSSALLIGFFSFADPMPGSGTLSPDNRVITYTGGPFLIPTNASDSAAGPVDCNAAEPCEDFGLTIDIPDAYKTANPNDYVKITVSWDDPTGLQDLDIFLVNNPDDGSAYPAHGTNGGDNPEVITITMDKVQSGPHQYFVRVVPFISTGQTYTTKIELVSPAGAYQFPPQQQFLGIAPRYYNFSPGPAIGEDAGEPSIGYNLTTHRAMYIAGLQTLRVSFAENLDATTPAACDATWDDVSYIYTKTRSLDPILFTDQRTGRTFVSQLDSVSQTSATGFLIGLNSFMAYSDDDGASWTPAQTNPPQGGFDHQTVGAGPYPASVPLANSVNKGDAVYYCSQAQLTAFCSRSDDGGLNFAPGVPVYNAVTDGCGGIHGHVKVAPDGTVYLPNRGCNGVQSVTISEDAGNTWTVRQVQGVDAAGNAFSAKTPPGILDPSVGIATDGTLYFTWVGGEEADSGSGHVHVAVSHDKGVTWTNDYDLGASQNIHNAVFVEAVAGDSDRAAVGFIGTTEPGDHQAATFKGIWYAFIATTYDGGKTWATVNATPNAPVQREGGICNAGTGCSGNNRNLLDFTEITSDERGRVLYSYADGCINECESGPPNSFSSKATIARQSGGKGLLAQFDTGEPVVPHAACLEGRRDDMASYLHWVAPDNGGSALTSYKIYRATAQPGSETQIGFAEGGKISYTDRGVDPTVATYTYRIVAINAQGDGPASNYVTLSVGPRLEKTGACALPGVELITDPTGDASTTLPQHDITSVSIAELKDNDATGAASNIQFVIKVADLSSIPPGWRWSCRFSITIGGQPYLPPDDAAGTVQDDWFVAMVSSDNATPTFTYGSTGVPQGAARVFTTVGDLDPGSNATADGTITLVLPKSLIGNPQAGDAISVTLASVRATGPSAIPETGGTNETIPDITGAGSYQIRPANLCLPNTAPTARLTVTPNQGTVPLVVSLDGSASSDPDSIDTIASYTFNFGDGSDDVTQSSPTMTHTFSQTGLYPVKLVVADSRGKVSANTDQKLVAVTQPTPTPTPGPTPTVTVSASPTSIHEGSTATYTITASRAVSQDTTVNYSMSGKATLGSDYTLNGTAGHATIAAGQSSTTITLSAIKDGIKEKSEPAIMTLQSGPGYTLKMTGTGKKAKPPSATVTISD